MRSSAINKIVEETRLRILEETGTKVLLMVVEYHPIRDMEIFCEEICTCWGLDFSWVKEYKRTGGRPTMKKVIWMMLKEKFPTATYASMAMVVGHQNHVGVYRGIIKAKFWLGIKDELFMKYYEPVKHLLKTET